MLSGPSHLSRPRPPGSRRSSAQKVEKVVNQDENQPIFPGLPPRRSSSKLEMERDLELDLPQDFEAAFKPRLWAQTRKSSTQSESDSGEQPTRSPLSLGRKQGRHVKDSTVDTTSDFDYAKSNVKNDLITLFRRSSDELHNMSPPGEEASEDEDQEPGSMESEVESEHSMSSMNSEWVGGLPREELETLLMQANRIIRDRERDLTVAAKIGAALLEKNVSLRSKHEGIISRLSSVSSFPQLFNPEQSSSLYSPPDNDSSGLDETPTPAEMIDGYFRAKPEGTLHLDAEALRSVGSRTPMPVDWTTAESDKRYSWHLPKDHFVPSVPASPTSIRHYAGQEQSLGQLQFSNETQRQLETLSEQNEALLEQLSDLQLEAEEAKKSGGKKLKKLNREIDGLRNELEAATERNFELERVAADEGSKAVSSQDETKVRRVWKRRGTGRQRNSSEDADVSQHSSSSTVRGSDDTIPEAVNKAAVPRPRSIAESDAGSIITRSESSFSTATQNKAISEPERALVAQLMSKIRELEETNATLALAGSVMDGRIGKAMKEGERIRDAYEAVENVAALEESQMKREDSDILETHFTGSPYSPASLISPSNHRNRRAPGNRYHIAGRRTVRAALKMNKDQDEYSYDSNDSSLAPSPVKGRGQRPRILITPSCEDLRGRARDDSSNTGSVGDGPEGDYAMTSTPIKQSYQREGSMRDFSTTRSFDSPASTPYGGIKSLGSELGSIFAPDDTVSLSPIIRRRSNPDAEMQRSGSIGSFNLRSRASLNSLRAPSEAESDIADLRWSSSSDLTIQADDYPTAITNPGIDNTVQELAVITTGSHLQVSPSSKTGDLEDGNWYPTTNDSLIPQGALQNEMESTVDSYEWIEKVTRKMPLHWADDDDFGKPITEKDARHLGLLEGSRPAELEQKSRGLLAWVQGKTSKPAFDKGKAREAHQIQSREQVEERERLSDLLREKRVYALQKRVLSGQISPGRARAKGVDVSQSHFKSIKQYGETTLEEEVTQRAIAYSTARSRRLRAGRALRETSRKRRDGNEESSDEEFEFLDLDPSKRRPGRRGTDYYPITLKDRYKPTMVKERAKQFSGDAITWASAWATLSLVMFFAYLVTFSQGPKRVLAGHTKKRT
jgi:hypothetical protein